MSQPSDAPGVIPSLGGSGPCPKIVHKDRTWVVGHPTQKAKGELELIVLELAIANNEAAAPHLPPNVRARKEAALNAAIDGGSWRTWGDMWQAVSTGPDSNAAFLLSLLREHQPDSTIEDARALWRDVGRETARAFAVVVPTFFSLLVADRSGSPEEKATMVAKAVADTLESIAPLLSDKPLIV